MMNIDNKGAAIRCITSVPAPSPIIIGNNLPKRLADYYLHKYPLEGKLAKISDDTLSQRASKLQNWTIYPSGTDGYHKSEVTGDLGGYNFQRASASGMGLNAVNKQ